MDPRWRYHAELSLGGTLTDQLISTGSGPSLSSGGLSYLVRGAFYAPVSENHLAGGGFMFDGRSHRTFLGEYRVQQDFADPRMTTHLAVGAILDVWPAFAIGPRAAVGAGYEAWPGVRLGGDFGAAVTAVHFRWLFDLAFTAAYMF